MATYSEYSNIVTGTTFDSDAQNLIDRMIAVGETPTTARQIIIDTTFKKLKGDNALSFNFYNTSDLFGFTAAHAEVSARMNWKVDLYNLTSVSSPTFTTDRGFTGDILSTDLKSSFNPSVNGVNYTLNSAFFAAYNRVNVATIMYYMISGATLYLEPRYTDNKCWFKMNEGTDKNFANTDATGFYALSRLASTGFDAYRNKVKNAIVQASTSLPNTGITFIQSNAGTKSNQNICFWWFGGGLSEAQENTLEDIIVGYYLTQIGAAL